MWKEPDGFPAFFESLDRGKKSVCIDLRKPEGKHLALPLGERVDVVVENFRPRTMEVWGSGYDEFKARNPGIIYAQATGWGTQGPLAKFPSFDQIARAYSGYAQHSGGGRATGLKCPTPALRTSRAA